MSKVRRVYVCKKDDYAVRARELKDEIINYLRITGLDSVKVYVRYDIENLSDKTYEAACNTVFAEPPVDSFTETKLTLAEDEKVFSVEYLPGQFDQRADSAEQCIKLLNEKEDAIIRSATTYVFKGNISDDEFEKIKNYCVNPVDSRITDETIPDTLVQEFDVPEDVKVLDGFISCSDSEFEELFKSLNLAMTLEDFKFIRTYFKNEENRDPSITEVRMLDTYWSDHCRHTTYLTELKDVRFEEGFYYKPIKDSYDSYVKDHDEMYAGRDDKYHSLMDIALLAMKKLKKMGKLDDEEESDEINACSIVVPVVIDGVEEEWLIFFKNETHNHPTEIEPFGGAATCLGGAIRDPLSGRGYVYQAMRVTGAADPTKSLEETMPGKLPQKKIVTQAALGYSSYGNQIGLATGLVNEIYHPDYVAKRMEIGAVMGAAPRKHVIRMNSDPGDLIVLIGGRTGRDGIGGATGSSKAHTTKSIDVCGAEVQKGNAPTERKIQRLFKRPEVTSIIKKCNDFGAGGVSVAIGELADGLNIDLDKVPKKYAGLDGTELAISESQERMAVVVDKKDADKMLDFAASENLEAVIVATVTEEPRLTMNWRGKSIVSISREFLNSNGAKQSADAFVTMPEEKSNPFLNESNERDLRRRWLNTLKDLNVCSQKGLVEQFDSSIGAGTVLMPYGGKYQLTPIQAMVAKLPILTGKCDTVTMMSYGMDPYLLKWSPYHGAIYAVVESMAKIVATGGEYQKIRFTFQEYFKRMTEDPKRWGEPLSAMLGAYTAQLKFGLPSIGGKDSMSGTFNDIDVPPTLCSFAVDTCNAADIISPEFKKPGNKLVLFRIMRDEYALPNYESVMELYAKLHELIHNKVIVSAYALGQGGIAEAVSKMAFGNKYGAIMDINLSNDELFMKDYGSIVAEVDADKLSEIDIDYKEVAVVTEQPDIIAGNTKITIDEALTSWKQTLESVYPTDSNVEQKSLSDDLYDAKTVYVAKNKIAKPKVFIPVFPGTNCEYDTARSFINAGADTETIVFKNMSEADIVNSAKAFSDAIKESQMIMFSGGFSAGDEPDGSAKFIEAVFKNPMITDAVHDLLDNRDGLILGICNGFQALIKLGLVPNGKITGQMANSPTLTTNSIGRHISKSVYTKVVTNKSPWLMEAELGGVYAIPASHGEGRFVADEKTINELFKNGQVATRYVDLQGNPTMDEDFNPNGSYYAIEGITSPDGRVLGKMCHSERIGDNVAINIFGEQDQKLFESGVKYFRG
ncbi:MAG: phosphoribosylformylglycinamidine synthase [Lachnospiraceae bacterium]|nr:phosphoribosylformylglycinamidine synthase [Lachnospiraceae bacterium]